jgi:hypothetical protein
MSQSFESRIPNPESRVFVSVLRRLHHGVLRRRQSSDARFGKYREFTYFLAYFPLAAHLLRHRTGATAHRR